MNFMMYGLSCYAGMTLLGGISIVTSFHKPREKRSGFCQPGEVSRTVTFSGYPEDICCKLWNYTCPINYFYEYCSVTGTWDGCRECPEGYVQPFPSNADSPIQCYSNTKHCSSDKIALNTTARSCVCNMAENYFPLELQGACDYRPCPIGKQLLINGTCAPCPAGSYKNWKGRGQCKPWRNCEELESVFLKSGTETEDAVCALDQSTTIAMATTVTITTTTTEHVPLTTTTNSSLLETTNSSISNSTFSPGTSTHKFKNTTASTDVKHQKGNNELGIIGAFIVGGSILLGMLVLAFLLRKRACPRKVRNDQLYLEMNLRGRASRHQYEQVQTSDEELDNSPSSPKIFQISSRTSRGGNRFKYPGHGAEGNGCYGNLVISSDHENLAEELTGLTVNLPDSPARKVDQSTAENGEEEMKTSGGSIPFDNFLRLTPLDSEGHQFLPADYESQRDRDWDYTNRATEQHRHGDKELVNKDR